MTNHPDITDPDEHAKYWMTKEKIDKFYYEIGQIAWSWNSIELLLDTSLAFISGIKPDVLVILLPEANIRRKFEIFQQLLKVKRFPKKIREGAADETKELLKLLKRRNTFIHAKWIAVLINKKDQVEGVHVGKNQIARTKIEHLQKLSSDMNKAYGKFITFLTANALYPSR